MLGVCNKYVPTTIRSRPTVTVWVDSMTTAHYYTSVIETERLVHTHTVIETTGCIKEINRKSAKPWPTRRPESLFGKPSGPEGHARKKEGGLEKEDEKQLLDKVTPVILGVAAHKVIAGVKYLKELQILAGRLQVWSRRNWIRRWSPAFVSKNDIF
jgi:hypothetical protein